MYKLLKWDCINFIKENSWLYVSFAAVIMVLSVFPDRIRFYSVLIDSLGAFYSFFFFGYTLFLSVKAAINWLGKDSFQQELYLPVPPCQLLLGKLIFSSCIGVTGLWLTMRLWSMIGNFGMARIVLFNSWIGFFQYLAGMVTLVIIMMFSYITAKSFRLSRNRAGMTTVSLTVIICILLGGLAVLFYGAIGAWNVVARKHLVFFVSPNEKLRWLITVCDITGPVAVITIGFIGCYKLLKNKYKQH
jgi:hypothetical protein